ncbi:hypothetical protein BDA99DRAFT_574595 [Phascolomyces articulosus]|uniref:Uncharacterized protein n=1 Tax=Phascolomyces articulosus TaxID=60185 RepID=A0AAD5K2U8_9FUNG|nr:hypothetical protein BDA99DRAFT_574595 [Phascolomyces articulosus]
MGICCCTIRNSTSRARSVENALTTEKSRHRIECHICPPATKNLSFSIGIKIVKHLNLKTRERSKFCWILLILTGVYSSIKFTSDVVVSSLIIPMKLLHNFFLGCHLLSTLFHWVLLVLVYLDHVKIKTQHFYHGLDFTIRFYFRYSTIKDLHVQYNANTYQQQRFRLTEARSLYATAHSLNASNITNSLINK